MEHGPFEVCISHVFPIENGDIPASYVSLPEGIMIHSLRCFLGSGSFPLSSPGYISAGGKVLVPCSKL